MELLLHLNKNTLLSIKNDLRSLHPNGSESYMLNYIMLEDFCSVIIENFKQNEKYKIHDASEEKIIRMLCRVFDSVDADSRGFISWDDFTNYCLRY